jgi:hypothetical protein
MDISRPVPLEHSPKRISARYYNYRLPEYPSSSVSDPFVISNDQLYHQIFAGAGIIVSREKTNKPFLIVREM